MTSRRSPPASVAVTSSCTASKQPLSFTVAGAISSEAIFAPGGSASGATNCIIGAGAAAKATAEGHATTAAMSENEDSFMVLRVTEGGGGRIIF